MNSPRRRLAGPIARGEDALLSIHARPLEAWFSRVLHTATATTLTGFHPFPQLAQPALEPVLAHSTSRSRRPPTS